ncbi:MAG: DUF1992 domain-containing protein [Nocardioides sp.]
MTEEQTPRSRPSSRAAATARIAQQQTWVDLQIQRAMDRGDFNDLPGAGKPIENLGSEHDPDWWLKQLIERERISGVLPASLQLRKEDAELDDQLDALGGEQAVRREVTDFNARVIAARYRLPEGPPLVTMPRDVDATVAAWAERRATRRRTPAPASAPAESLTIKQRWWRRG